MRTSREILLQAKVMLNSAKWMMEQAGLLLGSMHPDEVPKETFLKLDKRFFTLVHQADKLSKALNKEVDRLEPCTVPPPGWRCTRGFHADGPCAAVPEEE